ncbi:hypothetical protein [Priestia aryabhattai]
MKIKPLVAIPLLLCSSLLGACNKESSAENKAITEVEVSTTVKSLTTKEYGDVITTDLKNPSKEDFKKVNIKFTLTGIDNIKKEEVEMPNYKKAFNSLDKDENKQVEYRYWYGGETGQEDGNSSIYKKEFILYSKGLSNKDIKDVLDSNKIKTSWVIKGEKKNLKNEYSAAENIEFK